jgi:hypothetical protein
MTRRRVSTMVAAIATAAHDVLRGAPDGEARFAQAVADYELDELRGPPKGALVSLVEVKADGARVFVRRCSSSEAPDAVAAARAQGVTLAIVDPREVRARRA